MSETVTRCYVAEGDVASKIVREIREHNDRISAEADAIKEEIGAESVWFGGNGDGCLKGFKFPDGKSRKVFKEVRDGVKYPVQNTKEGKALAARLSKLRRQDATHAVQSIEEFGKHWGHMSGRYICFPVGVMLPYKEDPKILAKMSMSADKEHATPDGWREIKEWEFLKLIEEWNSRVPLKATTESGA